MIRLRRKPSTMPQVTEDRARHQTVVAHCSSFLYPTLFFANNVYKRNKANNIESVQQVEIKMEISVYSNVP